MMDKVVLMRVYLWHGLNSYVTVLITIMNTINILILLMLQLNLLDIFLIFGLIAIPLLFVIIMFIGRWDYENKNGIFQTEHSVIEKNSPIWINLHKRLDHIDKELKQDGIQL